MKDSFLTQEELKDLNFKSIGKNVKISRKASIYWPENMIIGDNVRIDDFCFLSGKIQLGSFIHISAFCTLIGTSGIYMEDFSGISGYVALYSASEDYGGGYLTNPTVPVKYRLFIKGPIILQKHVVVGLKSVILPNVTLGEGAAIGAMSLVTKSLEGWKIYYGVPVKFLKDRKKDLLILEKKCREEFSSNSSENHNL